MLFKPKTPLNKLNFLTHLLKIEWKSIATHTSSCLWHFHTLLRCWPSINSTVSSKIIYLCCNRLGKMLVLCRMNFKMSMWHVDAASSKGGFTQNLVTAYDLACGQLQSSHRLPSPYLGEFSQFRPASGLLKIVLSKPHCRGCRWWCSCCMWENWKTDVGHKLVHKP